MALLAADDWLVVGTVFDPSPEGACGTGVDEAVGEASVGTDGVDGLVGVASDGVDGKVGEGAMDSDGVDGETGSASGAGAGAPMGDPAAAGGDCPDATALQGLRGVVWILQTPGRVRARVWFTTNGS